MATYLESVKTSKEVKDAQSYELQAREASAVSQIAIVKIEGALAGLEREASDYLMNARNFDIQTYQDHLDRIKEVNARIANLKATSAVLFPAGK